MYRRKVYYLATEKSITKNETEPRGEADQGAVERE